MTIRRYSIYLDDERSRDKALVAFLDPFRVDNKTGDALRMALDHYLGSPAPRTSTAWQPGLTATQTRLPLANSVATESTTLSSGAPKTGDAAAKFKRAFFK